MSQKYNIKIDLKINSTVTEYNKNNSTHQKLLTEIEDEIKNYNKKISDLKSANKGLNGLLNKRLILKMNLQQLTML